MTDHTKFNLADKLSKDQFAELTAIFTEKYMPAVERTCQRYIYLANNQPSFVEDGKRLLEIDEKVQELRLLLEENRSALRCLSLYEPIEHQVEGVGAFIADLDIRLASFSDLIFVTPEADRARTPKKGRPQDAMRLVPEKILVFNLLDIYQRAHGRLPSASVGRGGLDKKGRRYDDKHPMTRAATILTTALGLKSSLARTFRTILELHRGIQKIWTKN